MRRKRDVYEDVLHMDFTRFEHYVKDIFNDLSGWRAVVPTASRAKDYSADVIATSPTGIVYVIQCKHYLAEKSKVNVQEVGYLKGALDFHKASFGIFIVAHDHRNSTQEQSYTAEAKQLAQVNGVRLWGLKELADIAKAAETGAGHYLVFLGLEAQTPYPLPYQRPEAKPKQPRLGLWPLFALLTLLLGWFGRDAQQLVLGAGGRVAAVEQAVRDYDQAYQADLNYGQVRLVGEFVEALLYEDLAAIVDQRTKQNCNLTTEELAPLGITSMEWLGDDLARVRVVRNWKQTLSCTNKAARVLANGPFEIEVVVGRLSTGRWVVINSSRL